MSPACVWGLVPALPHPSSCVLKRRMCTMPRTNTRTGLLGGKAAQRSGSLHRHQLRACVCACVRVCVARATLSSAGGSFQIRWSTVGKPQNQGSLPSTLEAWTGQCEIARLQGKRFVFVHLSVPHLQLALREKPLQNDLVNGDYSGVGVPDSGLF